MAGTFDEALCARVLGVREMADLAAVLRHPA